ncbi:hypothetical protein NAL32_18890 [Chryseobacterium sp. Ch-15]|uniref:Uncharacterized protein n=1 Tax=Chryseobacterium muglaense TaxID=2893752 RepID=A0A9Q3UWG2_9FLAO|nr:hypothetical protein [Chryseobacterium muglaense]MBD3907183.1 hypothetical protein [Chryseobacterium muglaense]MCC9036364.1 hypothetical protein [Chryseobacterium muglaense]MCM2556459.1 hypothetical protein [Chryseobacterium muglaense]
MNNNEGVTIEKNFPYHPAFGMLIAIPCFLFWGCLYYFIFGSNFRLGLIMIFTTLCIGTGIWIIKSLSKSVTIWFNDAYMFVKTGDNKQKAYLKSDIVGFYSFDYETDTPQLKTSIVKFNFFLKDGKKIYLNDSEYRSRYDEKKGSDLKRLLNFVQKELQFSKIRKKNFQNIYWYSDRN